MAEIISISLKKEFLQEIDTIQKDLNFSGRSEVIRAGLRNLIEEHKSLNNQKGIVEGTIIVTHSENHTQEFSKIKHLAHNIVKTHIHHELETHQCMEILLFKGDSKEIKKLYQRFLSSKKIDLVKVIIS